MILCLATFFDLKRPLYSPEADDHHALAKVALTLRDPMREGSSVWTVWTLLMMVQWSAYVDLPGERKAGGVMMGVVDRLVLSVSESSNCLLAKR